MPVFIYLIFFLLLKHANFNGKKLISKKLLFFQTNQKVNYFPIYSFHSRQKVWDDKIMKKALSENSMVNINMKFCQGSFLFVILVIKKTVGIQYCKRAIYQRNCVGKKTRT